MKYKVLSTILQRIDHEAGFYEAGHPSAGKPRNVLEHRRGDIIEFHSSDEYRIPELVQAGAIAQATPKDVREAESGASGAPGADQGGGDSPPSGP